MNVKILSKINLKKSPIWYYQYYSLLIFGVFSKRIIFIFKTVNSSVWDIVYLYTVFQLRYYIIIKLAFLIFYIYIFLSLFFIHFYCF